MRFSAVCLIIALLAGFATSPASAQVFDSPEAAAADPDFKIQGEYAGENRAIQVIARGDGDFEIVVYEQGLPGAGWNRTAVRRLDGDADAVDELIESMKLKRVERTSPTLGALPPADAVVLFDSTEQSLRQHWDKGAKRSAEGWLIQGTTTKESFSDYRLHLEFMLPFMPRANGQGRGNSGVYHQGRYETQILDSFGLEGKNNETGGIYTISDPALNMCFPPLVWQTYDVEFTAAKFAADGKKVSPARISASVNGVPVQTAVDVSGPTTAAPLKESPEPGPIHLQDHGSPVRFRNIWIVPRDVSKELRRPIVAGYEKLFADADPQLIGGRLLIESLGCQACHTSTNATAIKIGPVLDGIAERARVDHIAKFVRSPRTTKPGTTMPDPWHGVNDEQRTKAALAITNYLVAGSSEMLDQTSEAAAAERGKLLFEVQGCAACHVTIENHRTASASVPLGELGSKYTLASLSKFLLDPHIARPTGRMPKVVANAGEARDVASYLLRDVVVVPGAELVKRRVFRGQWQKLPDFAKLKLDRESGVNGFQIDDIEGSFAATFFAYLRIVEAGKYTFHLSSDDGARLLVDGKLVIDHDGIHPASEQSKNITLQAGVYPIDVSYFEGGGQRELKIDVEQKSLGRISLNSLLCATIDGTVKS